jgi:hypothetical protein
MICSLSESALIVKIAELDTAELKREKLPIRATEMSITELISFISFWLNLIRH